MDKKQKILDVLTSNYNVNLFSENGRLHIAQQIVDVLENKAMPEFGDDVITKERAEKMEMEKSKAKAKDSKKPLVNKNKVSKLRSKAKKITK